MEIENKISNYDVIREKYGNINLINHIFRSSLSCILGFSYTLKKTDLTHDQKICVKNIETEALALLNDIDYLNENLNK